MDAVTVSLLSSTLPAKEELVPRYVFARFGATAVCTENPRREPATPMRERRPIGRQKRGRLVTTRLLAAGHVQDNTGARRMLRAPPKKGAEETPMVGYGELLGKGET